MNTRLPKMLIPLCASVALLAACGPRDENTTTGDDPAADRMPAPAQDTTAAPDDSMNAPATPPDPTTPSDGTTPPDATTPPSDTQPSTPPPGGQ
jgi:hypothetical protein